MEEEIRLVLPKEENREDVLGFYREIMDSNGSCIGMKNADDYDAWLQEMRNRESGHNLPQGYVRENFYLCYLKDRMIGVFSLKFELTDYLLGYGGHIGYAIRPSMRRRGYATDVLRIGLGLAESFGFDHVLCVCDEDNIASEKTILHNGGVLEDIRYDKEENVRVKRYWITLPHSDH